MFDSLLDSWVGAAGVFSVLSLLTGPILVVLILIGYWQRRGEPVNPPLFPAIPLALTMVSIQLLAAALETNRLFREVPAGPQASRLVADALIHSRQSLLWRVLGCAVCIVIVAVFQMMMRGSTKAVSSDGPSAPSISRLTVALLGAVTLGAGILVWLYSDTLRFVALISSPLDAGTAPEAKARTGGMGIGDVTHFLGSRVNIVGLSAILLTLVLLTIGWRFSNSGRVRPVRRKGVATLSLNPNELQDDPGRVRPVRRRDVAASALLALIVLGWCGVSAAGMVKEIDFLRILELPPSLRPKAHVPLGPGPYGWAVGEFDTILRTSDGGATWFQQSWAPANPGERSTLSDVKFIDPLNGWAVGQNEGTDSSGDGFTKALILHTSDGGTNWSPQNWSPAAANGMGTYLLGVSFVDAKNGWAVGNAADGNGTTGRGLILHTSDGGSNWTEQNSETIRYRLRAVTFVDIRNGWTVGALRNDTGPNVKQGLILHTPDGGVTWNQQTSGTPNDLGAVTFVDAMNGWTVGDEGTILHTGNGGTTWSLQNSGVTHELPDATFLDLIKGWAVSSDGTILNTVDGGASWSAQNGGTAPGLNRVTFVDAKNGWAVGRSTILHTSDGGATWSTQEIPTKGALNGVSFVKGASR